MARPKTVSTPLVLFDETVDPGSVAADVALDVTATVLGLRMGHPVKVWAENLTANVAICNEHCSAKDTLKFRLLQTNRLKVFVSTEQTGTGAEQSIAHGLGAVPTTVFVAPTDTAPATTGAYTVTEGTHTSTNVLVTVTSGKKYKVFATYAAQAINPASQIFRVVQF